MPDISVAEAVDAVHGGAFMLDVREDDEWAAGHAPAATHIPMSVLAGRTAEIPGDATIVCVCHLGVRAAAVSDALNRAGWTAVNMTGGMQAWEAAGLPVVVPGS
jgi:rhodanese-related sulfurtransferase